MVTYHDRVATSLNSRPAFGDDPSHESTEGTDMTKAPRMIGLALALIGAGMTIALSASMPAVAAPADRSTTEVVARGCEYRVLYTMPFYVDDGTVSQLYADNEVWTNEPTSGPDSIGGYFWRGHPPLLDIVW